MDLEAAVATINHNMHFLWLEVRRVVDEQTGEAWYGIANTQADEAAKLATSYTEREIEFLKKLVSTMCVCGARAHSSLNWWRRCWWLRRSRPSSSRAA
jgi:hypothetical protein